MAAIEDGVQSFRICDIFLEDMKRELAVIKMLLENLEGLSSAASREAARQLLAEAADERSGMIERLAVYADAGNEWPTAPV